MLDRNVTYVLARIPGTDEWKTISKFIGTHSWQQAERQMDKWNAHSLDHRGYFSGWSFKLSAKP